MKFFIIHGTGGSPEGNWFPWLKEKLETKGHQVFVPEFPTTKNQSLENWFNTLKPYEKEIDKNTIFIGHSLGPAFILNIIEKLKIKIKGSILVSGFLGLLGFEEYDKLNSPFCNKEFNWTKIKNNCNNFYVISSNDDPYVPLEKGIELSKKLDTKLITIENAGHINSEFGFNTFEFILDYISKLEEK